MISPEVMKELLSVRQVLHYLPASPSTDKGWTPQESQLFWMALLQYPQGPWTTIAEFIGTKSTRQAMTHGQKLRQKLKRWNKRLRRNPAVGSLMDEITVSSDGCVSLGSSPLTTHPALVKPEIHPLYEREPEIEDPFVKTEQCSPQMKQEELCMMVSSYLPASALPDVSRYRQTNPSAALPPLYPSLNGPRPHLPVADKLAFCSDFAMVAPLPLANEDIFPELARASWGGIQQ